MMKKLFIIKMICFLIVVSSAHAMNNPYEEFDNNISHNITRRFNNDVTNSSVFSLENLESLGIGILGSAVVAGVGCIICDCWKWGEGPIWMRVESYFPQNCKKAFRCPRKRPPPEIASEYESNTESENNYESYTTSSEEIKRRNIPIPNYGAITSTIEEN